MFSPGASVTVDENLLAFRGRVCFLMFMPNKPAKFGLKIWCLVDVITKYLYNVAIYLGKDREPEKDLGEKVRFMKYSIRIKLGRSTFVVKPSEFWSNHLYR